MLRWTLVFLAACSSSSDPTPKEAPKAVPADARPPPPPPPPSGLRAPGNDKAIVAAVEKLLADCRGQLEENAKTAKPAASFADEGGVMTLRRCATFEAFQKAIPEKSAAARTTCLNLLEDKDVRVREAGLRCFDIASQIATRWEDAEAARIFDVLVKEPADSPIDAELASGLIATEHGNIRAKLGELALADATPDDVKAVLMVWWRTDLGYQAVKKWASSRSERLQAAAVDSYVFTYAAHRDEACAYWAKQVDNPNPSLAALAAKHLTGTRSTASTGDAQGAWIVGGAGDDTPRADNDKRCEPAQVAAVVARAEALAKAGPLPDDWNAVVEMLAGDKLASAAVRQRAKAVHHE